MLRISVAENKANGRQQNFFAVSLFLNFQRKISKKSNKMTSNINDRIKVQLRVFKPLDCYPDTVNDYFVAVVGPGIQLGNNNTQTAPRCAPVGHNIWGKDLWLVKDSTVEYKFLVVRAFTGVVTDIEAINPHKIYIGQKPIIIEHTYNSQAFKGREDTGDNKSDTFERGKRKCSFQANRPSMPTRSDEVGRITTTSSTPQTKYNGRMQTSKKPKDSMPVHHATRNRSRNAKDTARDKCPPNNDKSRELSRFSHPPDSIKDPFQTQILKIDCSRFSPEQMIDSMPVHHVTRNRTGNAKDYARDKCPPNNDKSRELARVSHPPDSIKDPFQTQILKIDRSRFPPDQRIDSMPVHHVTRNRPGNAKDKARHKCPPKNDKSHESPQDFIEDRFRTQILKIDRSRFQPDQMIEYMPVHHVTRNRTGNAKDNARDKCPPNNDKSRQSSRVSYTPDSIKDPFQTQILKIDRLYLPPYNMIDECGLSQEETVKLITTSHVPTPSECPVFQKEEKVLAGIDDMLEPNIAEMDKLNESMMGKREVCEEIEPLLQAPVIIRAINDTTKLQAEIGQNTMVNTKELLNLSSDMGENLSEVLEETRLLPDKFEEIMSQNFEEPQADDDQMKIEDMVMIEQSTISNTENSIEQLHEALVQTSTNAVTEVEVMTDTTSDSTTEDEDIGTETAISYDQFTCKLIPDADNEMQTNEVDADAKIEIENGDESVKGGHSSRIYSISGKSLAFAAAGVAVASCIGYYVFFRK